MVYHAHSSSVTRHTCETIFRPRISYRFVDAVGLCMWRSRERMRRKERKGKERKGKERKGKERKGKGKERKGRKERKERKERKGKEGKEEGKERTGAGPARPGPALPFPALPCPVPAPALPCPSLPFPARPLPGFPTSVHSPSNSQLQSTQKLTTELQLPHESTCTSAHMSTLLFSGLMRKKHIPLKQVLHLGRRPACSRRMNIKKEQAPEREKDTCVPHGDEEGTSTNCSSNRFTHACENNLSPQRSLSKNRGGSWQIHSVLVGLSLHSYLWGQNHHLNAPIQNLRNKEIHKMTRLSVVALVPKSRLSLSTSESLARTRQSAVALVQTGCLSLSTTPASAPGFVSKVRPLLGKTQQR